VTRLFEAASAGMVLARLPLLPADPGGGCGQPAGPLLAEAVAIASRQAGGPAEPDGGEPPSGRRAEVLRAYELRARFRPTPHGAFAGIAVAQFSRDRPVLLLGSRHKVRSYPSGTWLDAACTRLLDDTAVLSSVTFTTSNLITRRGDRFETCRPRPAGAEHVTVRATAAVTAILGQARSGATAAQLTAGIHASWPHVPRAVVHECLRQLACDGFLLTGLLPENPTTDPLGHMLRHIPAGTWKPVRDLRSLLCDADRHAPGTAARLTVLRDARKAADVITEAARPLVADVAVDARLVLPAALAAQAEQAASVLWRTGLGRPPLTGYHDRFKERYGTGRLVPLREVTDPVTGLGMDIEDHTMPSEQPRRDEALAAMVADAIAGTRTEAVLDANAIAALSHDGAAPPPRTAELIVRVVAASQGDLSAGRFRIAVTGGSPAAGATQGRFTGLIRLPQIVCPSDDVITAELVTQPARTSGLTLAPPTGLACRRIPVGVPPRNGDLSLHDLYLASNGQHMVLWSGDEDRPVVPVAFCRLAPHMLHGMARFLQLIGQAGCYPLSLWSWGAAAAGPFQPRVAHGPVILAPARWVLPPSLRAAAGRKPGWEKALASWRQHSVVPLPDVVLTQDHDRTLPLDLNRPDDRELLRRYVHRGVGAVTEPPGGPDAVQGVVEGPDGRHALELVIPFRRRTTASQAGRPPLPRPHGTGLYLPGGPWLSLAIRCPAPQQSDLLAGIAGFAADLGALTDCWFWLRYASAALGPHLRVRFHGDPAVLGGQVLPAACSWCTDAIRNGQSGGFSVEPYEQETERYGGPDAITAAEQVFAADSALVLSVLARTGDPARHLVAAAAAITCTVADGDPAALEGRRLDRGAHRRIAAARPDVRAAGDMIPYADPARTAAWLDSLSAYRAAVDPAERTRCASSLVHMHQNRLLGDNTVEPLIRALAADSLAAHRAAV
jgi:thiopeptide-type bacteriocin biosynthesis protein